MRPRLRHVLLASVVVAASATRAGAQYQQTNLVSDVVGNAPNIDGNLQNAWGISFLPPSTPGSPSSPFWVSNEGTNTATLYNALGVPQALVVSVPTPTGQIGNTTADFTLSDGTKGLFLFASLNGNVYGWNPGAGTTALLAATGSAGASYDGLALGTSSAGSTLYAANNAGGGIDAFNASLQLTTLAGSFIDPNLPAGFKAYNVQNLGGTLFVTYNSAAGGGVVDMFDQNGNFLGRVASNGAGGTLNAPWGVAIAPTGFGQFAGDLLVGNRGNGMIDAFNLATDTFVGTVNGENGSPIVNSGLWGLTFNPNAPGTRAGAPPTLYIAAGPAGYSQGLFAAITPVPEPSSLALCGAAGVFGGGFWLRRRMVRR